MKILLTCRQCDYQEWGLVEKKLMNKIIMWNHVKKMHPGMAGRLLRNYNVLPNDFFGVQPTYQAN